MSEEGRLTVLVEHLEGYEFRVKFDWESVAELVMDEPPPLGECRGPNASRLLTAAVANCLSASLAYCLDKNDVQPASIRTAATCTVARNPDGRLRVSGLFVRLQIADHMVQSTRRARCLELFEDFCVVSASIRQGIPLEVEVVDSSGNILHRSR